MTYCLGWRTECGAYLVADAAVTSTGPLTQKSSAFGEAPAKDQLYKGMKWNTEEAALKITHTHGAAISFAGDADVANSIRQSFHNCLKMGQTPREAVQAAVQSNTPFEPDRDVQLICAFLEHGQPQLVSFNDNFDLKFKDHGTDEILQFGSIGDLPKIAQLSAEYISTIRDAEMEGNSLLACVLGLCQSFGLHNNFMEFGIGGVFSGCCVFLDGFHWQPDILYLPFIPVDGESDRAGIETRLRGESIFAFVEDDFLYVRSAKSKDSRIFYNNLENFELPDVERLANSARVKADRINRANEFDYIVFINCLHPVVGIVGMNRKQIHRRIILDDYLESDSNSGGMFVSPELLEKLSGNFHFPGGDNSKVNLSVFYDSFVEPRFDVEHLYFKVKFHGDEDEEVKLPPETIARFQKNRGSARIFKRKSPPEIFGTFDLFAQFLQIEKKSIIDLIPEDMKIQAHYCFRFAVNVNFGRHSVYMMTTKGERDIRWLRLGIGITWYPDHLGHPCLGVVANPSDS